VSASLLHSPEPVGLVKTHQMARYWHMMNMKTVSMDCAGAQ